MVDVHDSSPFTRQSVTHDISERNVEHESHGHPGPRGGPGHLDHAQNMSPSTRVYLVLQNMRRVCFNTVSHSEMVNSDKTTSGK